MIETPLNGDPVQCYQRLYFSGENAPATLDRVRVLAGSEEGDRFRGFDAPLVLDTIEGPVSLDGGFLMPNVGLLDDHPVVLELKPTGTTRVSTVSVKYTCTDELVQQDKEARAYFKSICTEMTELADVYRSPAKLRNFDFGQFAIKCAANDDKEQCTCMTERLRTWKQLQVDYEWGDCQRFGFAAIDFAKTTADLLDEITTRKCVSAPCGQGGFCSKKNVCNTDLYRFIEDDEESCGKNAGCCEPPCTLAWIHSGLVQPGNCRNLDAAEDKGTPFAYGADNKGRVQRGNEICYPLDPVEHRRHEPRDHGIYYDDQGFHDVGVFGCTAGELQAATHCCAAVGCTTGGDFRRDPIDGLCMDKAVCEDHPLNTDKSAFVSNRCNDPSYGVKCCGLDTHFAFTSREVDNPRTNQQSAIYRPAFRDSKTGETLESSAGVVQLTFATVALVFVALF